MMQVYFNHTDAQGTVSRVDCNDRVSTILLRGYVPETADAEAASLTEQFEVQIRGSTAADIAAKLQAFNRFFLLARERMDLPDPVYLWFSPADGITPKRSRVLDGRVILGKSMSEGLFNKRMIVTIAIERRPYWEGAEVAIPLSNPNGSNVVNGLRVYNANDLAGTAPNKRANYADIAAGVIQGDLPAPMKISAKNLYVNYGDNRDWMGWMWIALGHHNPFSIPHKIEAEASNPMHGTVTSATGYSNGKYLTTPLIPNSSGYVTIFSYPFSGNDISAFAGQRMRILLRTGWTMPIPPTVQLRVRFDTFGWVSDWHSLRSDLSLGVMELFDIRIPPNLESVGKLSGISMHIDARSTAEAMTKTLDDILILPTDGFCEFSCSIPANGIGVIDGINNLAYQADATDENRSGLNYLVNAGLDLIPGKAHRIYIVQHLVYTGTWDIDQVVSLTASYRPRFTSL